MAWRFRKSFSPLPGVRLTLSPSGISTSVGVGPLRLAAGPRGPSFTATVPGTGLSFRQSLAGRAGQPEGALPGALPLTPAPVELPTPTPQLEDIKSAGSGALTTVGLAEFKRLLEQARREHGEIARDLTQLRAQESAAVGKYTRWKNGWLLRHLFKAKFQQLRESAEESTAHRAELEEQEKLSRLQTQLNLPPGVERAFHRLCDEFAVMSKSHRIWDTVGQRSTNKVAERTTASRAIDRRPVNFQLAKCELIESEWNVPHLENANGGDIFFYPAFVLYFVTSENFALLEYSQAQLGFTTTRFLEEEPIPPDSKTVGSTWAKANKDGSPDKRFKDNYQIPIAQYGALVIVSATGMNEQYMVSNAESAEAFARAWQDLAAAVRAGV